MVQLASPVELLKGSWEILQARWKTFVVIQLLPALFVLPIIFLSALGFYSIQGPSDFPDISDMGAEVSFFIVAILFFVVIQLWSQGALIFSIKDREDGIGFKEAYKRAWKVLRSYLWVSLLVGLVVFGGALLLVIPGLIFAVWFCFAGYIVIDQGVKGTAALKASKALVGGRFWAVVWRFLVIGILGLILTVIGESASKAWENTSMAWIGALGSFVVSFVWTPFAVGYIWLLYLSLKKSAQ